jgi:hypothetical protein
MEIKVLVKKWFDKWEEGDYLDLPISENFKHTSPFGIINGKDQFVSMVEADKDKFLGHHFIIHDEIYEKNKACVRYTTVKENFTLDVSEWYFIDEGLINDIVSYYNIEQE